jgi:hypothetical protein
MLPPVLDTRNDQGCRCFVWQIEIDDGRHPVDIVAARYPEVISPPYAAMLGTLVVYPVMVAMWWRLHRPGGNGR